MSISLSIIHAAWAPQRRLYLMDLLKSLGGIKTIHAQTVAYQVSKDIDRSGVWPTVRKAWKFGLASGATHHLVVQDDALASKNFLETVHRLIEIKPDELICFFSMRKAAQQARARGEHWFTTNDGCFGISLCFPIEFLAALVRWERTHVKPDCPHDDTRVANYLKYGPIKKRVWHPSPSLIEHAAPSDSILGNSHPHRVAKVWVGDQDPLEIDWSLGAETPFHGGGSSINDKKWML